MLLRNLMIASLLALACLEICAQQKRCFTSEARASAERSARVWTSPGGYDPVLGYDPAAGARVGALPTDENGRALPIKCVANKDKTPGAGTTPKFHCSIEGVTESDGDLVRYKVKPHFKGQSRDRRNGEVYGEFLASRFSRAIGFFADDEWVADVTCPDCEKSLTSKFQSGASWNPFQPAAGIELSLGKGIDANCDGKDSSSLSGAFDKLINGGKADIDAIDAFKLWLAFIDHGDTKTDNQKYACLKTVTGADGKLTCEAGQAVFYVSDMGSTFGHSSKSERKATLHEWKERGDPIKLSGGRCATTAKGVGDVTVGEGGRALLAGELQRLLDAEKSSGMITKVFAASRNAERDQPPESWTTEFVRKARAVINARCSN